MSQRVGKRALHAKLTQAGAWTLAARMAFAGFGLLINLMLARMMAPEDFGVYLLAASVVTILVLVAQLGLQVSVVRLAAQAKTSHAADDPTDISLKCALIGFAAAVIVGLGQEEKELKIE